MNQDFNNLNSNVGQNNNRMNFDPMTGQPLNNTNNQSNIQNNNFNNQQANSNMNSSQSNTNQFLNNSINQNNNMATNQTVYNQQLNNDALSHQQNYNQSMNQQTMGQATPINNSNYSNQASTKKSKGSKVPIIMAIIGIIFALFIFMPIFIGANLNKGNTFYAEGYSLKYGAGWSKTSITNALNENKDALAYLYNEAYLLPIGTSSLSEYEEQYSFDFSTDTGKQKLYDEFYSYWNNGTTNLYGGSNGFSILTGNIYYATMDYGLSTEQIKGKMYLLVSKENNIIISLMSNTSKDLDKTNERVLEIIKTINIDTKYDDEMAGYLDSMSSWNVYSSARKGKLGTKKDINGGWRILGETDAYWVFKNGEFWWYKSMSDLSDNYWYGTTKIYTGAEGFKYSGLDEDKLAKITVNSRGLISSENVYTLILTPKKIISDGIDKSSTNIVGEDWKFVWVIVDHGSEGLEGQSLNLMSYDLSYYVKVSD